MMVVFPIALLGLLGLGLGGVSLAFILGGSRLRAFTALSTVALAAGVWTALVGGVGYQAGLRASQSAVAQMDPGQRVRLLAEGEHESTVALGFGLGVGGLCAALGAAAFALGISRATHA